MSKIKSETHNDLIDGIYEIIHLLLKSGGDELLAEFLLQSQINSLVENDKHRINAKPIELKNSLTKKVNIVKNLLRSTAELKGNVLTHKLAEHMIDNPRLYPEIELAEIIFELQDVMMGNHRTGYHLLREHVLNTMSLELGIGLRSEEDWSIDAKLPCGCEYCNVAMEFLKSKTQVNKIWPIIMEHREHISKVFDGLCLPVNISVQKSGSPHKLVLVKLDKIYYEAKTRYITLQDYYSRLANSAEASNG